MAQQINSENEPTDLVTFITTQQNLQKSQKQDGVTLLQIRDKILLPHTNQLKPSFTRIITKINRNLEPTPTTMSPATELLTAMSPATELLTDLTNQIIKFYDVPKQLAQQSLINLHLSPDEIISLISTIYPTDIENTALLNDIHTIVEEHPKPTLPNNPEAAKYITLGSFSKIVSEHRPFYASLFTTAIGSSLSTALTNNHGPNLNTTAIVNLIIQDYRTPRALYEKIHALLEKSSIMNAHAECYALLSKVYPSIREVTDDLAICERNAQEKITKVQKRNEEEEAQLTKTRKFGSVSNIEDAWSFLSNGLPSKLNFDAIKSDLTGIICNVHSMIKDVTFHSIYHDFEANPSGTTKDEILKPNPAMPLQQMNTFLQNWPSHVSKLTSSIEITGRGPNQSTKRRVQYVDNESTAYKPTVSTPRFQQLQELQLEELFSTPQQQILLLGTLGKILQSYQERLEAETVIEETTENVIATEKVVEETAEKVVVEETAEKEDVIEETTTQEAETVVEQPKEQETPTASQQVAAKEKLTLERYLAKSTLANKLSLSNDVLLTVLSTCMNLVFLYKPLIPSKPTAIVGRAGTGKSTLLAFLIVILQKVNVPVIYMANENVLVRDTFASTELKKLEYRGFYCPTNQADIQIFTSTNFTIPSDIHSSTADSHVILLFDCKDDQYLFQHWTKVSGEVRFYSQFIAFTFSSAAKNISPPQDKTPLYETLHYHGIVPYYMSQSINNYLYGMTQLQLLRYFEEKLHLHLARESESTMPTQQDPKLHQNESKHIIDEQATTETTSSPTTAYFGQQLLDSLPQLELQFNEIIQTNQHQNGLLSVPTLLSQINSKIINNTQNYPLFQQIITHPIIDALVLAHQSFSPSETESTFDKILKAISPPTTTHNNHTTHSSSCSSSHGYNLPYFYCVSKKAVPVDLSTDLVQWKNSQAEPDSTLFSIMHRLWYDLSVFKLYGLPTTRIFSHMASQASPDQHCRLHDSYQYHRSRGILPIIHPRKLFFTLADAENYSKLTPEDQKDEKDISLLASHDINNSASFGFEWNFINSILTLSEDYSCHLPFHGYSDIPITKIISHNYFFGIRHPQTPMLQRPSFDPTSKKTLHFFNELQSTVTSSTTHDEIILFVPPCGHADVDFYVYRSNKNHNTSRPPILALQFTAGVGKSKTHHTTFPRFLTSSSDPQSTHTVKNHVAPSYCFITSFYNKISPEDAISHVLAMHPKFTMSLAEIQDTALAAKAVIVSAAELDLAKKIKTSKNKK